MGMVHRLGAGKMLTPAFAKTANFFLYHVCLLVCVCVCVHAHACMCGCSHCMNETAALLLYMT